LNRCGLQEVFVRPVQFPSPQRVSQKHIIAQHGIDLLTHHLHLDT